jgi:hypothetical protein
MENLIVPKYSFIVSMLTVPGYKLIKSTTHRHGRIDSDACKAEDQEYLFITKTDNSKVDKKPKKTKQWHQFINKKQTITYILLLG